MGLSRNKSGPETKPIDLNVFITEVIRMVERKASLANVRILYQPDPDLPAFPSDRAQLQQVFLNLLNNALYALKGREGGEVRITTSHKDNVISISVADDGCGIDPKIIDKIFLPFFTTKPVGEGTGLGLSTSFGIVERLGGQIQVNSEQNAGTVFTVRFPLPSKRGGTRPGEDRTKEDMKHES